MKTAIVIRHVAFEDLGSFAAVLKARGYDPRYLEAGLEDIGELDALSPELLVVLGGPIGAYEEDNYPFVRDELRLLERRLAADRPTLGLCLGSQLMARALGARVYPGPLKEIGWAPLRLTEAGRASPLRHLAEDTPLLHWHGDTFDLPTGATLLASTERYPHQAYAWGRRALAFQCHPEVQVNGLERWYIGHTCELSQNGISIPHLRSASRQHAPLLETRGSACFTEWLDTLE